MDEEKSQITIDNKTRSVLNKNLSVDDREILEVISSQDALERPLSVKRAPKIGVITPRDVIDAEKSFRIFAKSQFLTFSTRS